MVEVLPPMPEAITNGARLHGTGRDWLTSARVPCSSRSTRAASCPLSGCSVTGCERIRRASRARGGTRETEDGGREGTWLAVVVLTEMPTKGVRSRMCHVLRLASAEAATVSSDEI